jgi:ferredoxin
MPTIRFLNDEIEIEVEEGASLQSAAHEADSGLPFGCRAGTCGTCVIRVVVGSDTLEEPSFVEADTLGVIGVDDPRARLACQTFVGEEDIEVEYDG